MAKSIESTYKSMSQIEHILKRSGMYIGSVKEEQSIKFTYDNDTAKMVLGEVTYTPGLLKLIDEIISNSVDEYRRKTNMGLNTITVEFNHKGDFKIKDNGGIPVVMHKEAKLYVPEFIFGQLRTSSNYNDDEERDVIGTNGLGCKIANIFSKKFAVYTADKKKSFYRSWTNNMQNLSDDLKIDDCSDHFTEFTFKIDFDQFEDITCISPSFAAMVEKRCIDAAAANAGLTVNFCYTDEENVKHKNSWHFNDFAEYIELYSDYADMTNCIKFADKQKSVYIFPDSGINVGFVNGAECSKGTHIKAVRNEINNYLANAIGNKHKIELSAKNIDNKYTMFCDFHIANPSYDSQTKDTLTTPVERFSMDANYKFSVPKKFLDECASSEITNIVLDWYKQKSEAEDQKTIRKLNKQASQKMKNSDKFIGANGRKDRELWLFEGFSAAAGFRTGRNPQTQAAYLLRGKVLNTSGMSPSRIMENQELSDIVTVLGLQWGKTNDIKNLNFSKIIIATDQDYDGSAIAGLLINFFNKFPELFENQIIYRSVTPIIIARKNKDIKKFYNLADYKKAEKSLSGYKITYVKGLGTLQADDFKEMLRTPRLIKFSKDELSDMSLKQWFSKNDAADRKNMLKTNVEQ